jgi:hypothetical protein
VKAHYVTFEMTPAGKALIDDIQKLQARIATLRNRQSALGPRVTVPESRLLAERRKEFAQKKEEMEKFTARGPEWSGAVATLREEETRLKLEIGQLEREARKPAESGLEIELALARAEHEHALVHDDDAAIGKAVLKLGSLEREPGELAARVRSLEEALRGAQRQFGAQRSSYARAVIAPLVQQEYHDAIRKVATALTEAADANSELDHLELELRQVGVPIHSAVFPGLSRTFRNSIGVVRTELGRWCGRLASRGVPIEEPWGRDAEHGSFTAVSAAAQRDQASERIGAAGFDQTVHMPARNRWQHLVNETERVIGRLLQ